MMKKVLVAMSGGVDSSVAAYLLKESRYQVVGVTMCFGINASEGKTRCCGPQAIEDARKVCYQLGIPHYVMDFSKDLEKMVISKFVSEYLSGRTPNPCIDCNRFLKFEILLKKALGMGFDFLATGHYTKIENINGDYFLKKAIDWKKDQSYFLYPIKREYLKHILFPLADLTKEDVRKIAKDIKLVVYNKPQSQDICFIIDKDYRKFLDTRIERSPGPIMDLNGNILGRHKGISYYTIGQREGLGISSRKPLYVIRIEPEKNRIIVGGKEDLKTRGLIARDINILVEDFPDRAYAKIRYRFPEAKCYLERLDGKIKVVFEEEQPAITPGQSVVFYKDDVVLGGGIIESAIKNY